MRWQAVTNLTLVKSVRQDVAVQQMLAQTASCLLHGSSKGA
jgi:hypothetical protein